MIIDSRETKTATFIDKLNKIYSCSIYLVNKSDNKHFVSRYEYYKKIFNKKLEERFAKHQKKKEEKEKIFKENNSIMETDFNKTR
jgi:hypothetical protein